MDTRRAQEIISSPSMINVTYNGNAIYIENVNPHNETANIHMLNQPEKKQQVPLSSLREQ